MRGKRILPNRNKPYYFWFRKAQGEKPRKEFKKLALKFQSFEKKATDIIEALPAFTFKAFEKHYYTNRGTKGTLNEAFATYAAELREAGRIGTAVSYECAQNSLAFPGNVEKQPINDFEIDENVLSNYTNWINQYRLSSSIIIDNKTELPKAKFSFGVKMPKNFFINGANKTLYR